MLRPPALATCGLGNLVAGQEATCVSQNPPADVQQQQSPARTGGILGQPVQDLRRGQVLSPKVHDSPLADGQLIIQARPSGLVLIASQQHRHGDRCDGQGQEDDQGVRTDEARPQ